MLPVGIIVIRRDYTILFWNECIADWSDIPASEITGQNLLQRFPGLNKHIIQGRIDLVFDGGPAAIFSPQFHPHFIPAEHSNGGKQIQRTTVVPHAGTDDFNAMIVIEDVTDLYRQTREYRNLKNIAEKELDERRKAEEALALASKKLTLLSSITRHDINNQLMALYSYISLSEDSINEPAELKVYFAKEQVIANAISNQIRFTKDYENLGVKAPVWQNVSALLKKIIPQLPTRHIEIDFGNPHLEVFADPLLEKVFYNLVDNALRYGGDQMTALKVTDRQENETLVIHVEDNGVGIPHEDKLQLFVKGFGQNTGLGLFLSREILSITGITITETGEPGKGARFEMVVPKGMFRFSS